MTLPLRILIHAIAGLAIGASLVALAAMTAFVLAFTTSSRVVVPAIIEVSTSLEPDGTTALEFLPNPGGAILVIVVFAAIYTAVVVVTGRRRARRA